MGTALVTLCTALFSVLFAALFAALFSVLFSVLFAVPAHAQEADPAAAAESLRDNPLYVAPGASDVLGGQESSVRTALQESEAPIYAAIVPAMNEREIEQFGTAIYEDLRQPGTYVVMTGDGDLSAASTSLDEGEAAKIAERAAANNEGDAAGAMLEFVDLTNQAADNGGSLPNTAANTALLAVLALLVLGGIGLYGVSRQRRKRREAAELAQAKTATEEDVVKLGEDIARLDLDVRDADLDPAAREDYTRALDSYDEAKRALAAAYHPEQLRNVTSALEDGRYAMACVRARLDGRPLPERRAPCFFNPQHGPSVTDVYWAPAGGAPREVPVCAADKQRLDHGQDPEMRQVLVDGVRRPYWEGGRAYAPWAGGYYGAYGMTDMFTGLLIGSALSHMMFGGFGYGMGGYEGDMGAGGDFGGGDFGGGFGGGDFGGGFGDFGGGDF